MVWNGKTALVTGGCGFIGTNLVSMLAQAGARVHVFDNLSVGSKEAIDGLEGSVKLIEADVRDLDALTEACKDVSAVFHLAAQPGVIASIRDPEGDFQINAGGAFNALLAAQRQDAGSFVLASSNAVVGEFTPGADETATPRPLSPYGASKLAAEGYCSAFAAAYGMHTAILRFANAYGPHSGHKKQNAIPRFIERILNNGRLVIYDDGNQVRDFIYVEDICRAMMLAAERDLAGEVVHVASGKGTTVLELVRLFEKLVGRELPIDHEPRREGEAYRINPSVEKAKRVLGFEAQMPLEEGLAATYDWFQRRAQSEVER